MTAPALAIRGGALRLGGRTIWTGLDLEVAAGELVAVLGPNGSGKTSLVRVLLGLLPLDAGTVEVAGEPPGRGSGRIGYVPQQRPLATGGIVRGREFVGFGLDGHRLGLPRGWRPARRQAVDAALAGVDALDLARRPVDTLSGGQQQRLRIAQALVGDPSVLLCDEPLLSLDVARQSQVVDLIDQRRRDHGTAVVFVTHEINPVLGLVDRVLYLVNGRARSGPAREVLTGPVLSELYGTPIEVVEVGGRMHVVGGTDDAHHHHVHGDGPC